MHLDGVVDVPCYPSAVFRDGVTIFVMRYCRVGRDDASVTACSVDTNTPTTDRGRHEGESHLNDDVLNANRDPTLAPGGWGETSEPRCHGGNGPVGFGVYWRFSAAVDESLAIDRFDAFKSQTSMLRKLGA